MQSGFSTFSCAMDFDGFRINSYRRVRIVTATFSTQAFLFWNRFPAEVREAATRLAFKLKLDLIRPNVFHKLF